MSRIIAGKAKGRRLAAPKGSNTRPTTDRTREALFSVLASWFGAADGEADEQLAGVAVLDLFAGSGAVGLEAASRGAGPVVLVEADRATAALIESNAALASLRVEVRAMKAQTFAASKGHGFDLVFLDPPYDVPTERVDELLTELAVGVLANRGLVVVERSGRSTPPRFPVHFTETWLREYGETTLYFGALS